jgi:O-antigen ligase
VFALAAADGGYFPTAWGAAALAFAWIAGAALLLRPSSGPAARELAAVALLAGVLGWISLSAIWSDSVPLTLREAERTLGYPVALAAFLLAGRRRDAEALVGGVVAGAGAIAAWNLVARIVGVGSEQGAAAVPVGYANGLAAVLAIGAASGAWLLPRTRGGTRALLAAAVVACLADIALTGSRGGWIALAAGAAAGLATRSRRPRTALALVVALGLAAVLAGAAVAGSERPRYWEVAAAGAVDAPVLGSGGGTFERAWLRERDVPLGARDAHNLYLESFQELGAVGLVLLAAALAVPLVVGVRAPAPTAGYVVFLVHAAVDWDWELPVVVVAALACAAALLLGARREERGGRRARVVVLAGAGLVAAAAVVSLAGHAALEASASASREADWQASERWARRAARLRPWDAEPWERVAVARAARGRGEAAREALRRAVAKDPGDPDAWRDLAAAATGEERRRALARAALLDPIGG